MRNLRAQISIRHCGKFRLNKVKNESPIIEPVDTKSGEGFAELSAVFAVLAAAATVTSLCYRVGFFVSIDKKLIQFLSLSDIVPSSLHFVVWILFMPALGFASRMVFSPSATTAKAGAVLSWVKGKEFSIVFWTIICLMIFALFTPQPFSVLYPISVILGVWGVSWAVQNPVKPIGPLSSNSMKVLVATAATCVMVFFSGGYAGEIVLSKRTPDVSIALVNGKAEIGVLVWTSSETVFVRDDIRKIKLIPRDQIANVEFYGVNSWTPSISIRAVWSWLTEKVAHPASH